MQELVEFNIVKHTGKSGYAKIVDCVGFKSIDTATYNENDDTKCYPVYAPYLKDRSFSYENWIKFKLNLNKNLEYTISSRGITFKNDCGPFCYNRTYTKIKNIAIWFNMLPTAGSIIRIGVTNTYNRPIDTLSSIAVEDIATYYNNSTEFDNSIKIPLFFNGKNELTIQEIENAINDSYIVLQLEVTKGLTYQLDYRALKYHIHYEVE